MSRLAIFESSVWLGVPLSFYGDRHSVFVRNDDAPPGHEAEIRRPGTDIWYLSHVPDKPSRG